MLAIALIVHAGATPVAVLHLEAIKRGLKSKYQFVETREATAMYDQYEVMEAGPGAPGGGASARMLAGPPSADAGAGGAVGGGVEGGSRRGTPPQRDALAVTL